MGIWIVWPPRFCELDPHSKTTLRQPNMAYPDDDRCRLIDVVEICFFLGLQSMPAGISVWTVAGRDVSG